MAFRHRSNRRRFWTSGYQLAVLEDFAAATAESSLLLEFTVPRYLISDERDDGYHDQLPQAKRESKRA